jgi:hypothetical protein
VIMPEAPTLFFVAMPYSLGNEKFNVNLFCNINVESALFSCTPHQFHIASRKFVLKETIWRIRF